MQVFLGVLANFIFFLLGYSSDKILTWWHSRNIRKFWQEILDDKEALLILSTHSKKRPWNTYRISFTEAEAYEALHHMFEKIKIRLKIQQSDNESPISPSAISNLESNNLVVFGSPSANPISKDLWDKIQQEVNHPFEFCKERPEVEFIMANNEVKKISLNKQFFRKSDSKWDFMPILDEQAVYEDKRWISDYGIILKTNNPYNHDKTLIMAMGCHGVGTFASVKMITNQTRIQRILKEGNSNFLLFLKYDFSNQTVVKESILYKYDLSTKLLIDYTHSQ